MSDPPKMLVVDDEDVICQACRRIFSRQGFQVDTNTDAVEGLDKALQREHAVVLLDVKMPKLDGIEFLERLREQRVDAPVVIMTGYPSIPDAAAAIRLGVSDYITKPFTSEEITRAVRRIVKPRVPSGEPVPATGDDKVLAETSPQGFLFCDEAWLQLEADGSASVGVVLPGLRGATVQSVCLPRIGEVVYQGLPLASLTVENKPRVVIRSPISGVVAGVNEMLLQSPDKLLSDPCGEGWVACLCTTRFEEEAPNCRARRLILLNADPSTLQCQSQKLSDLGCQVCGVADRAELPSALKDPEARVLLIDAASFGDQGPELVSQVNVLAPATRVVVVASPDGRWESAFRKQRIFYYAVEPFTDNEMADILDAAFHPHESPSVKPDRAKGTGESLASISITNRNGHKVQLMPAPGLLRRGEGLGHQLAKRLLERSLPMVIAGGEASLAPTEILKAAGACDRLLVLAAKDSGQLPGSLTRDAKVEIGSRGSENAARVTALTVQPDAMGTFAGLDPRTTAALAEHIVREMASY